MAQGDIKDLPQRSDSDKILRDKAFNVTKNPNYDGYQRGLASMVYKIFHKNSLDTGIKCEIMPNQLLAEVLHKPVLRQVIKRKMYSSFEYKIRGVDLTDMQLISKFIKYT